MNSNVAVFMSCLQKVHPLRYCRLDLTHKSSEQYYYKGRNSVNTTVCAVILHGIGITVITSLKEAFCKSQISTEI
jgi:hypothetical protein